MNLRFTVLVLTSCCLSSAFGQAVVPAPQSAPAANEPSVAVPATPTAPLLPAPCHPRPLKCPPQCRVRLHRLEQVEPMSGAAARLP